MNEVRTLTPQEQKVSDLAAQGHSNKKIGTELGITEKTVKFHLTKVYKKLGLNRYQLIGRTQAGVPLVNTLATAEAATQQS